MIPLMNNSLAPQQQTEVQRRQQAMNNLAVDAQKNNRFDTLKNYLNPQTTQPSNGGITNEEGI